MAVSPFDHPFLSGLLGDDEAAAAFSAEADLVAAREFELELARAQGAEGLIPAAAAEAIVTALSGFVHDMEALRTGTARDGVVVPELVRQMRKAVGPQGEYVHFGATSQDVVDTSLAIRLKTVVSILDRRLASLVSALEDLDSRFGATPVMAHTRMQAAIPVTASRKIASWRDPLLRGRERLAAAAAKVTVLTLGGAAGTLDRFDGRGSAVAGRMAAALGLGQVDRPRHSERDGIADLAAALSLLTGSLGKIGQDVALAAQSEVGEIRLTSGGGSSAMPHKVNPVGAETLVALSRFNATLVSGMHHALVHENERSGAAWTLEWMILPQMAVAAAAALRIALDLVDGIEFVPGEDA
ncbi:MAG: 3-carboxy-cis,cis-muconate cycloisomerase [Rhizobiaceae bacterium]|nr:3-carboxy-cis,cis-muconate cycloisomerase [Rhizobiaceae bacterium]MCV0409145.1 3-carboxy-cis,cis-muconate cycloisomerase [Rhizobiaceae bacterium]